MRDAFAKTTKRPAFTSTSEAEKELKEMLSCGLFVRVEKNTKRSFAVCKTQDLEMDGYYTWIYEGSQWLKFLTGVAVMLIVFAGVMFPLWPMSMRVGVSYLSYVLLGLLGLLMVIIGLRFVIYIVTVLVFGRAGWLFPRLFEDLPLTRTHESFIPVWKWEEKTKRVKAKEEKDE
jgi:translocation protein SEC62